MTFVLLYISKYINGFSFVSVALYASDDGYVGLYKHKGCRYFYMGDTLDGLALMDAKEPGIKLSSVQIQRGLNDSLKAMVSTIRNISSFTMWYYDKK